MSGIVISKIKKQNPLPPITDDEKPFELPEGWEWARFPDVCSYGPGKTPSTKTTVYWEENDYGYPWVSIADMTHNETVLDTAKCISKEAAEKVFKSEPVKAGTLLMSFKLTVGKIAKLGIDAFHNEAIISIHPYTGVYDDYVYRFLPSRALAGNTKQAIMGATLNSKSLCKILIPLAPEREQQRIVAKVDELMALCDQLEQQQESSISVHQTLVKTLLGALTKASERDGLTTMEVGNSRNTGAIFAANTAWARIAEHFDTLFTSEWSIDQLKQTILQLAVMGKLVPQDPTDEPASELLKKIAAEKAKLIKEGKIKQQKPLPPITGDETTYQLPEGWVWCRLAEIIQISSGTGLTAANMATDGNVPVYGGNGVTGYHNQGNVFKKTLVIGRVGYYCGSIHITPDLAWVTDNAFITFFSEENIYLKYLAWLLKGTDLKENESATAQPVISGRKVYPIIVGLPPTDEQHRIVAKVDELMALCDTLKANLNTAQTTQLQLADTMAERAVA